MANHHEQAHRDILSIPDTKRIGPTAERLAAEGLKFTRYHSLLGIVGIAVPPQYLVGAAVPAKRGSRCDVARATQCRQTVDQFGR